MKSKNMNTSNLGNYLEDVYSQLTCNASEDFRKKYITYPYTIEEVNQHKDYFQDCYERGLSAYKSLLFFHDFKEDMKQLIVVRTACGIFETNEIIGYENLTLINTEILSNECQCGEGMCGWRKFTYSVTK